MVANAVTHCKSKDRPRSNEPQDDSPQKNFSKNEKIPLTTKSIDDTIPTCNRHQQWSTAINREQQLTDSNYLPDAMLTTTQAADVVGVSAGTLRTWRQRNKSGQPPYHKPGGWMVRYRYSELIAWLEANAVTV